MFDALADIVITTQPLIKAGWVFKHEHGDKLTATRGDKELICYRGAVDGFLEEICDIERREHEDKVMAWLHAGAVCPSCKKRPAINSYSCSDCGWDLFQK